MSSEQINEVFLLWRRHLARVVSKIVPPHDIEDIVQETYVRACQFSSGIELKSPRAFMVKIARNIAIDKLKCADTRLTTQLHQDDEIVQLDAQINRNDPYSQLASDEEFVLFCEAVRRLPLQCRRVFVLKKVYGYSQKEISMKLSISENTVEKHVAQGIKKCILFMKSEKFTSKEFIKLKLKQKVKSDAR